MLMWPLLLTQSEPAELSFWPVPVLGIKAMPQRSMRWPWVLMTAQAEQRGHTHSTRGVEGTYPCSVGEVGGWAHLNEIKLAKENSSSTCFQAYQELFCSCHLQGSLSVSHSSRTQKHRVCLRVLRVWTGSLKHIYIWGEQTRQKLVKVSYSLGQVLTRTGHFFF